MVLNGFTYTFGLYARPTLWYYVLGCMPGRLYDIMHWAVCPADVMILCMGLYARLIWWWDSWGYVPGWYDIVIRSYKGHLVEAPLVPGYASAGGIRQIVMCMGVPGWPSSERTWVYLCLSLDGTPCTTDYIYIYIFNIIYRLVGITCGQH